MACATTPLEHFNTNFKTIRTTSTFYGAMALSEKFTPRL
jgi:hypothetical protein